jgi:peroxiredoxin Q/BCP
MLKIGDSVPEFEAKTISGKEVSSKSMLGKKYIVYFYPKDFTPGCDACARSIRDNYQIFEKNTIPVFGVSGQPLKTRVRYKEKFNLPYTLLLDEDNSLSKKFGVYVKKKTFGREYMGIQRTTFLISEKGTIEEIFGGKEGTDKVKTATHAKQILQYYGLQ